MARIGLAGLTVAPYTSGGDESAVVYGTGIQLTDILISANTNITRESVKQFADNKMVESYNGIQDIQCDIEAAHIPDDIYTMMLGYDKESTSGVIHALNKEAPYVGFGFIVGEQFKGTKSYLGYWFHKAQFSMNTDNNQTRGESTTFNGSSLSATVLGVTLESAGEAESYMMLRASTESAVRTWLNDLANITSPTPGPGGDGDT